MVERISMLGDFPDPLKQRLPMECPPLIPDVGGFSIKSFMDNRTAMRTEKRRQLNRPWAIKWGVARNWDPFWHLLTQKFQLRKRTNFWAKHWVPVFCSRCSASPVLVIAGRVAATCLLQVLYNSLLVFDSDWEIWDEWDGQWRRCCEMVILTTTPSNAWFCFFGATAPTICWLMLLKNLL